MHAGCRCRDGAGNRAVGLRVQSGCELRLGFCCLRWVGAAAHDQRASRARDPVRILFAASAPAGGEREFYPLLAPPGPALWAGNSPLHGVMSRTAPPGRKATASPSLAPPTADDPDGERKRAETARGRGPRTRSTADEDRDLTVGQDLDGLAPEHEGG